MKVFLTHSFQDNLENKYYELIEKVMNIIYQNKHEIFLGGLSNSIKETLCKYSDSITCYSIKEYQEEINNCPNCKYYLVDNGFIRTKKLCEETDCVIVTPGGTGTFSEIFSVLEEYRLKKVKKKIYLLNYEGYYDDLDRLINKLVKNNFNKEDTLNYIELIDINKLEEIMKEGI